MNRPQFGGGSIFHNKNKLSGWSVTTNPVPNPNPKMPDMTGDIEITKECAQYIINAFKEGQTHKSKRKNTDGRDVVKLEIAGHVYSNANGQSLGMWLQEPYKPKPKPEPEPAPEPEPSDDILDDEIPF